MANLCHNSVLFTGDKPIVEGIKQLFRDIAALQDKSAQQYLPAFVTREDSSMQYIEAANDRIDFYTRWTPDLVMLKQIADHYNAGFIVTYDDVYMGIYGEATYADGKLRNIRLAPEELLSYQLEPDKDTYIHNGKPYHRELDLCHQLLEEKKEQLNRKSRSSNFSVQQAPERYQTQSNISKEALTRQYGELSPANLVLKFAQHKNFDKAKELFQQLDEQLLFKMDNHISYSFVDMEELYTSKDKFIAMKFLVGLIDDWNEQRAKPSQTEIISLDSRKAGR